MSETSVRKKATKKTTRKVAAKKVAAKTAVKKTTTRIVQSRKAPTTVAQRNASVKRSQTILFAGIGVFLLLLGIAVAIGVTGDGEIVIDEVIADLKKDASPKEKARIDSIPVQKTGPRPRDGGLVASGAPPPKTAPVSEPVATSTDEVASSTQQLATSTDIVSEEVDEETIEEEVNEDLDPLTETTQ